MLSESLAWQAVLSWDRLLTRRDDAGPAAPAYLVTPTHSRALAAGDDDDAAEAALASAGAQALLVRPPPPQNPPKTAAAPTWRAAGEIEDAAARLLDLYLPLVLARAPAGGRPRVIAHLAQSLDGRIATACGTSQWISGNQDLVHNHRMRALCDAVLVGAETVIHDDPQLTCREVEGAHPTRVVLDPRGRVSAERRIFQDRVAPTVVIGNQEGEHALPAHVTRLQVGTPGARIAPGDILDALAVHGIHRLFVEGGGLTVSAFLQAGLLDRLQITVAPMIIGSGRASISLPDIDSLEHALRPEVRRFVFDTDVMFECVFAR
ncbi:RibD family protein [Haliangium ochraceum]|uniref:5-amino-6-(5-phosphoribosylamino)uracilreductase n=1 Tax=Haliangium ochraceum (strain DSM 14365 / JCM 11303 / SMP-2) TaxID=502025 RepID=D0LX59_HALO1|nr:RibD family protein [Haliangium ochraceum]ACY16101.1 5-amino-6-(5-phosphoribosylamino)uracilreductase [Haliangium ochraceum DSM 14365]